MRNWVTVLLIAMAVHAEDRTADDAIRKGVAYLAAQRPEGGFWKTDAESACADEGFHVASGALACLAILGAGDLADDRAKRALRGGVEWLVVWGVGAADRKESDRES